MLGAQDVCSHCQRRLRPAVQPEARPRGPQRRLRRGPQPAHCAGTEGASTSEPCLPHARRAVRHAPARSSSALQLSLGSTQAHPEGPAAGRVRMDSQHPGAAAGAGSGASRARQVRDHGGWARSWPLADLHDQVRAGAMAPMCAGLKGKDYGKARQKYPDYTMTSSGTPPPPRRAGRRALLWGHQTPPRPVCRPAVQGPAGRRRAGGPGRQPGQHRLGRVHHRCAAAPPPGRSTAETGCRRVSRLGRPLQATMGARSRPGTRQVPCTRPSLGAPVSNVHRRSTAATFRALPLWQLLCPARPLVSRSHARCSLGLRQPLQAKGGSFAGDKDFYNFRVGDNTVIPAFEEAILGMRQGGVRRIVVPVELGYPDNDFNKLGPKPSTFSVSACLCCAKRRAVLGVLSCLLGRGLTAGGAGHAGAGLCAQEQGPDRQDAALRHRADTHHMIMHRLVWSCACVWHWSEVACLLGPATLHADCAVYGAARLQGSQAAAHQTLL